MRRFIVLAVLAVVATACSDEDRALPPVVTAPHVDDTWGLEVVPSVVEQVAPSVVSIRTPGGEGSGVVFDADGIVVTNAHVVGSAQDVSVTFADGATVGGEVLATDEVVDIAVVRADRRDLPAIEIERALPRVGSLAIAVGNPLGFENTVTVGIVSALHRQVPGSGQRTAALVDLIQTDAAISPGNSGGALLGADGELIGLNVAYIPPQARAVSIGFAIPAATVAETVEQLLEDGDAEHAWLGLVPQPITPALATEFDLGTRSGVLIAAITQDGPADVAGMRAGDALVELDGSAIGDVEDLLAALRAHSPGETVRFELVRDGERRSVQVRLGDRP